MGKGTDRGAILSGDRYCLIVDLSILTIGISLFVIIGASVQCFHFNVFE